MRFIRALIRLRIDESRAKFMINTHHRSSRALFLAAALWMLMATVAEAKKTKDPDELFNPLLGVQWSHWLVGPIAEDKEIEAYLQLTSDAEAEAFAETFWAKRNQGTAVFKKSSEDLFKARTEEANKRFTEGTFPGNRTARGTVLIIYGEPEKISFESPKKLGYPPLEIWEYGKDSEKGLDDKKPKKRYRFVEIDGSTVLYTGQSLRVDPRARLKIRN